MVKSTRAKYINPILGLCEDFSSNQLPTKAEVIKFILFHQKSAENKYLPLKPYIQKAVQEIKNVLLKTDIKIISDRGIEASISKILKKLFKLQKNIHHKDFEQSSSQFKQEMEKSLFDISSSKCTDNCICSYELKISAKEKEFLNDQRNERKLFLGKVDFKATKKAEIKRIRRERDIVINSTPFENKKRKTDINNGYKDNSINKIQTTTDIVRLNTKRVPLPNVAQAAQRFNVSVRATATICTALIKGLGSTHTKEAIDKNQIQRNVSKLNKEIVGTHTYNIRKAINESRCSALFFDGKKEETNIIEINNDTSNAHQRKQREEHISIVFQPKNMYYTHTTPSGSKAIDISNSILHKLEEDRINMIKIKFIGCDGTPVNTGDSGGM